METKKLKYCAFFGAFNSLGITQKLENTVEAAAKLGYQAEVQHYINRPHGLLSFIKDLVTGKEDIIILRFYDLFMPFIFPFLLYRRMKGTKLILDVPTPRQIQLKELPFDNKGTLHIKLRNLWNYFSWTWVLIPFNRIIQYAEEGGWFALGVKYKTIKMGNGIKIAPSLSVVNSSQTDEVRLIGVATLAAWHGYDRLIKAVAEVKKRNPDYPIKVRIVGDGQMFAELNNLVNEYNLKDSVELTGSLHGEQLTQAFDGMQFGVSSLGLLRKGLAEASDLKTREYMARGLCVIGAGSDPDFSADSPYRLLVPNDESIEPIVDLLLNLKNVTLPKPSEIRAFAENNLSFDAKISKILGIDK